MEEILERMGEDPRDLKQEQDAIEDVAKHLCWKKVIEKNDLAIWQKHINHIECINSRKVYKMPHICKSDNPDAAWYKNMETCITPLPEVSSSDEVSGGSLEKWPERAFAIPPRIVALLKYQVWVMNVVPAIDQFGLIYERGLIGTYQDWCEAFSTIPRTYDLIHASGVFGIYQDRCDITVILLEMDRILRPEGTVIFRGTVELLVKIKSITDGMRWKSQIMDHESGPFNPEKILLAVKTYWTGEATTQKQD
ncbi:S-adenosyl-L-methionine-dependent methyltransferases superfamily protein [Quillaja saponaria]|uniref:Methyltransferase n=1 Tax=Quillaja saponaria TaxID=32244 RepID=A0AAD7PE55_QUISA|nr:S-adenosyl-L-methionine-dependent methyltransferases superfamily protein [Quillaja saponaria]